MNKDKIINKMKKSCFLIGILCILAAAFQAFMAFMYLVSKYLYIGRDSNGTVYAYQSKAMELSAKNAFLRNGFSFLLATIIMILAAIMFFYISKTGIPFAKRTMTMVRLIGVFTILESFLPGLIAFCITKFHADGILFAMISPVSLIEGLLIFSIAYIIKYGTILQQESDETL